MLVKIRQLRFSFVFEAGFCLIIICTFTVHHHIYHLDTVVGFNGSCLYDRSCSDITDFVVGKIVSGTECQTVNRD